VERTASHIVSAIARNETTASAVVDHALSTIEARDSHVNAFLSVHADHARKQAQDIDQRKAAGETLGPLAGVPVALKDNICTSWGTTTCASKSLKNYTSPYDAHVVEQLRAADAIIIGKTNLDEFAMGSSTENSAVAPTRNPWDTTRVAGGSSGGSVVAVADGMVPVALGSDTGGSIRQPASFCNVVGFKPSYGRISRYGLVAFGSSLDQIGPIGRSVEDVARVFQVIAGHDDRDSTCVDAEVPAMLSSSDPPAAMKIGVPVEYFGEGLDDDVRACVEAAIEEFKRHGAEIVELHMPHLQYAISCYYIVCTAEASGNLARYDGVHYGYREDGCTHIVDLYSASRAESLGPEVKRRIMLGTYSLSSGYYEAYYQKALKVRTLIKQDFDEAFKRSDVVLSPTSPVPAFEIGARSQDPLSMYLADIYTVGANLAGVCAISLPCGTTPAGLPVGLQLQGPAMAEANLLRVASAYESWTPWADARPVRS
jgi:aspartyl-tRNA(Asn)/glutamyl-tRNA(Gln) amidotransferase subunit A